MYILVMDNGLPLLHGNYSDPARALLRDLRNALLRLHKTLLDNEKYEYEQVHAPIGSPGAYFQLVLNDPWFAWLRPMSGLVVRIDEALDAKEPITDVEVRTLIEEVRTLIKPSESAAEFQKHYYEALQRDTNSILAHAEVSKLLAADRDAR
jgi:hypothetical protein